MVNGNKDITYMERDRIASTSVTIANQILVEAESEVVSGD